MEGMDELLARAYTQEQAEQDKETQTALLLTEGTYRTLPALTLTARVSDRTKVQDNGGGEKGGIGLTMSPDRVTNDSGRPDASSQRWTQAVTAFKTANGRDPDTLAEVAGYVRDYPVRLRIRRLEGNERFPEPSNFVVALSPVRD